MHIKLNLLPLILIIAAALLLVVVASGLLVWAAAGIGWVLTHWLRLPFTLFETTLLSLIALLAVVWAAVRLVVAITAAPTGTGFNEEEDEEEDDWDEDDEDWDEDDEDIEEPTPIPSIPKWRQPLRRASDGLPIVSPDDKCPCGSGRKYKNCHGRKK